MSVVMFDEPAKGRKKCPSCLRYVSGLRTTICGCGYQFVPGAVAKSDEPKVVNTFDEGGKGRKQCPSCHKFVGVKTNTCLCGHQFVAGESTKDDEPKVVNTFDEGGKGRKQCPSCEKFVGAKTITCQCSYVFKPKSEKIFPVATVTSEVSDNSNVPETRVPPSNYGNGFRSKTWVPSGSCPHKLDSTDFEAVQDWALKVRRTYENNHNSFLTLHGLKYWVKHFYPTFRSGPILGLADLNPDYVLVKEHLNAIFPEDLDYERGV